MDLATFNSDMARRTELARRLGRSPDYLWQLGIAWRGKRPSPELAQRIEAETATWGRRFRVSRKKLRPDLWG
jgi:DNA-binding transcriptional regulator YdaS (Cro superfamily)